MSELTLHEQADKGLQEQYKTALSFIHPHLDVFIEYNKQQLIKLFEHSDAEVVRANLQFLRGIKSDALELLGVTE